MKFTDGYWQMRPDVTAHFPVQVAEVEIGPDWLQLYAATRRLNHRGDTLNLPLLTLRLSSPMPNVIRLQLSHHQDGRPRAPQFPLLDQPAPPLQIWQDEQAASLTSGRLTVRVEKAGEWRIDFKDGQRLITRSGWRGMGYIEKGDERYIHEQLDLGVGECVYGLGERFTSFVKNGQVVDIWNEDGGTSSELAYKNIPFYLTNRGYGVFVNHPERVSFEVASEKVERVQFSLPGQTLDYFLIYGPSPAEVLERYTRLTGRPALPPAWSFGLWLSTSFTTDYDEATVSHFIEGMAERELPLHVFHFDCFWMKAFHWCDFQWDASVFPDPAGMLARLKARGLHICLWINPYIAQRSALFAEGLERGYLVQRPDGDVWQWDSWQAGMALVDFTNPAAREWYAGRLRHLLDMGVDCFKTDFGERIPTDVVYFDDSDPLKMHNFYPYLYNQTVFELLQQERGPGEAVLFARSATAGGQQFPVHWGGDSTATFESMAESLRGGLSLALSGFAFWSHDIGGFEQTASADVYKRWCAFGLLSSHSRLHGSSSYRVPWHFDEEAVEVLRFFTRLKCRLMPTLFAAAKQASQSGLPLMRPMMLAFPGDPACDYLDRQYMLGDALLVAPVMSADGWVDYYLPPGQWTHFLTGELVTGGSWQRQQCDYLSLPLLARPNSAIAVGAEESRPDYDFAAAITFHLFQLQAGSHLTVPLFNSLGEAAGAAEIATQADRLTVHFEGSSWRVLLRSVAAVRSVAGGRAEMSELGTLLIADTGVHQLEVQL